MLGQALVLLHSFRSRTALNHFHFGRIGHQAIQYLMVFFFSSKEFCSMLALALMLFLYWLCMLKSRNCLQLGVRFAKKVKMRGKVPLNTGLTTVKGPPNWLSWKTFRRVISFEKNSPFVYILCIYPDFQTLVIGFLPSFKARNHYSQITLLCATQHHLICG